MKERNRIISIPKDYSFFLFGARGTGKSSLLRKVFPNAFFIDLLDPKTEEQYALNPSSLITTLEALNDGIVHIMIDEIQKVPKLLDCVHLLIEKKRRKFIFGLTGSSARKLKAGGANLLAGRAALRELFPLTTHELNDDFRLEVAMAWGTLPQLSQISDDFARRDFLEAYAQIYLKEEVWSEQLVRKLDPFRRFLEIAAIGFGKILNHSKIAVDIGVDSKTVQSYYSILEDTLLGFQLPAFHTSVRKRQRLGSKFYFFDNGVCRALSKMLTVTPTPRTSYFGELFEQWFVNEIHRLNSYCKSDFRLSYLQSGAGVEVDLVIERPGLPVVLLEIKSTTSVSESDIRSLKMFEGDFPEATLLLVSNDARAQKFVNVQAFHWRQGLEFLFPTQGLSYKNILP